MSLSVCVDRGDGTHLLTLLYGPVKRRHIKGKVTFSLSSPPALHRSEKGLVNEDAKRVFIIVAVKAAPTGIRGEITENRRIVNLISLLQ